MSCLFFLLSQVWYISVLPALAALSQLVLFHLGAQCLAPLFFPGVPCPRTYPERASGARGSWTSLLLATAISAALFWWLLRCVARNNRHVIDAQRAASGLF
jgi:hypothetical protein